MKIMDAEKWKRITSSFSTNSVVPSCPPSSTGQGSLVKSYQVPSTYCVLFPEPLTNHEGFSPFHPPVENLHSKSTSDGDYQPLYNVESGRGIINGSEKETLEERITSLSNLLLDKSRMVENQALIITNLERKLEKSPVIDSDFRTAGNESKDPMASKMVSRTKNLPKPAHSSLSTTTGKSVQKLLPEITSRLDDLDAKIDKLVKSLPRKLQLYSEKILSRCKFQVDESGNFLQVLHQVTENNHTPFAATPPLGSEVIPEEGSKIPVWLRSPRIRPKVNFSSKVRGKTSKFATEDNPLKERGVADPVMSQDIQTYLSHLEAVVSELKQAFVHLLLAQVKGIAPVPKLRNNNKSNITGKAKSSR